MDLMKRSRRQGSFIKVVEAGDLYLLLACLFVYLMRFEDMKLAESITIDVIVLMCFLTDTLRCVGYFSL